MNNRDILELWAKKHNTAEIARQIQSHCNLRECDVDTIIANHMAEQFLRRKNPLRALPLTIAPEFELDK